MLANVNPLIASRVLHLDWVGGGSNIHVIELGPDGMLYGSSYLPNLMYRSSLDGSTIEHIGQHTFSAGHPYSVASLDDHVYPAPYPDARISFFDSSLPFACVTHERATLPDLDPSHESSALPDPIPATYVSTT